MKVLIFVLLAAVGLAYGMYEQGKHLARLGRMARNVAQTQGEQS